MTQSKRATDYARAKEKYWGSPVPEGKKHGQSSYAAKVYGCPCKECLPSGKRSWMNTEGRTGPKDRRTRNAELRARKKKSPVPEGTGHGIYAYRVYQCRCDICKAAQATVAERQKNAWRARSHGRWTTVGDYETICWPPKDAGPDWVCPGCASSNDHKEVA